MTDYERGIRDAIRYRMTHVETYTKAAGEPRTEDGHYRISFEPDRINPGELLEGSAKHRERMIGLWQAAATAALSPSP